MSNGASRSSLTWEVHGDPTLPWLVINHGMGLDRVNMRPLAELLSGNWQVLLWDMPGHGDAPPASNCRMILLVGAMEQAMVEAGVENPVVVGFSFGGCLAQYAISLEPQRYKGLVAYGCYAPFHQPPPVSRRLIWAVTASYAIRPWRRICRSFSKSCAISTLGQEEALRAVARSAKTTFVSMIRVLLESFDLQPTVRFDMPLLILRGAADDRVPAIKAAGRALLAAHPEAKEIIIPNSGHCAHNDNLTAVSSALASFLSEFYERTSS